jgi:site-specific DNA-cytosine methylase
MTTAVDLFCGAGGASLGIEQAGFGVVAAADTDADALDTHAHNLFGYTVRHDLSDVDLSVLPERAQTPAPTTGKRHVVSPCASAPGFSRSPDWFEFQGPKTSQYEQVGNAVPPRLQSHVARHLLKAVLPESDQ